MDRARADILAARHRLDTRGWIARNAENFRHLPPPAAAVWLGEEPEAHAAACDVRPLAGAGWTLHPVGNSPQGRVDARWLDAGDAAQRAELLADLPTPHANAEANGADAEAAPFDWAHRALCRRGLRLRIGDETEAGRGASVFLQLQHQPRSAVEAPLLVLELLPGVQCVLIETHEREAVQCRQPLVQNLQVHVRLGEGATLRHLRVVSADAADRVAHHLHARLGRGARYEQATVASGSRYQLHRQVLELNAERAAVRSAALLFAAEGALEQQLRVVHAAPGTTSDAEMLALASGSARVVANANTLIARGAAEAQARQRLAGIPIAGQPKLVLRPHLEINDDRVQAAHGATWGALPEDALFYARQRGLDERSARGLIVAGMAGALLRRCFTDEGAIEAMPIESLVQETVARQLAGAADSSQREGTNHG